jgi:hypothetical protein
VNFPLNGTRSTFPDTDRHRLATDRIGWGGLVGLLMPAPEVIPPMDHGGIALLSGGHAPQGEFAPGTLCFCVQLVEEKIRIILRYVSSVHPFRQGDGVRHQRLA